ncbi:MAG TPA: hypothetical protein VGI81_10495 [Tepidisphaeraceae bacterium]
MSTPSWLDVPPLPEIGHPETYYAKQVARADRLGLRHAHEAYKVGQYITLALGPRLTWEQKARYFRHALHGHCVGPDMAPNHVMKFYGDLAEMVRKYAGQEAIRLASREDDAWAAQLQRGVPREQVKAEAARFFNIMLGDERQNDMFLKEDWEQLHVLRKAWL